MVGGAGGRRFVQAPHDSDPDLRHSGVAASGAATRGEGVEVSLVAIASSEWV